MKIHLVALTLTLLALTGMSQAAESRDEPHSLEHGGLKRSYLLHVPAQTPAGPLPLVVVLHGGGGNAASAAKMTGFDAEADQHGFIVVYPDGTGRPHRLREALSKGDFLTWNSGHCCSYAKEHGVDDVGFIRAVVADVERQHPVDSKRVYATGISNGAMMSYRLACEASDLFAAVAPVAGIIDVDDCKPTHPVSVIDFQGTADENVPMDGGVGKKALEKENRPPVQQSVDFWRKQDGCGVTVNADATDLHMIDYGGCDAGTAVDYYIVQGGGHDWPGGDRISLLLDKPDPKVPATDIIWSFFAEHPRP